MTLDRTRRLTGPLALFDLCLGGAALLLPGLYLSLLHGPDLADAEFLLRRTGALWLVFAAAEALACAVPRRVPESVLAVAVLRLMDVPADLVYVFAAPSLTLLGRIGIAISPPINLVIGLLLLSSWHQHVRRSVTESRS
ncbi:MAG: hypothetical protein HZA54_11160 [Planctomycetes bacterium]|nr:hypothetical protein [Planctomycetota bacterium]